MLASELFAKSQGTVCSGPWRCYWCGSGCSEDWLHDDGPPVPFLKRNGLARCPSEPWICVGCFLWRRPRVTVPFLTIDNDPPFKDRQCAVNHSWFVTEDAALAIQNPAALYQKLLAPPKRFFLSLLSDKEQKNHLQLCEVNDFPEVRADTPIAFTLDNIKHTYTVYELEEALRSEPTGKEPGVQAIMRTLGPYTLPPRPQPEKKRGRPAPEQDGKQTRRPIS